MRIDMRRAGYIDRRWARGWSPARSLNRLRPKCGGLVLRMPPGDGALGRPSAVPAGRGAASSWQKRIRSESRSEPPGAECGPHDEPQPAVVLVTGMMLCPSLLHPPVRACSTSSTAGLALLWTGEVRTHRRVRLSAAAVKYCPLRSSTSRFLRCRGGGALPPVLSLAVCFVRTIAWI